MFIPIPINVLPLILLAMVCRYLTPLLLLLLLLVTPALVSAQTGCSQYILLKDGASYELLTYDKKDKQTGRVLYQVKEVDKSGGKTEATIHSQMYDQKDKLTTEGNFKIGCDGGSIWMDMRSLMNPEMMESYKDMELTVEGDKMLYPNQLEAGQKLGDGTMTMKMKDKNSGRDMMTMVMKVVDRTVEGKENIKVPAGSYDSYKIRHNTEMENRAMGMKMPGMRVETVEYYVPELGTVRSETYRNGKLLSYSVLNKVSP